MAQTPIIDFYRNLLGREPGAEGLEHWRGKLAGGMSLEDIEKGFKTSEEYKNLNPIESITQTATGTGITGTPNVFVSLATSIL